MNLCLKTGLVKTYWLLSGRLLCESKAKREERDWSIVFNCCRVVGVT